MVSSFQIVNLRELSHAIGHWTRLSLYPTEAKSVQLNVHCCRETKLMSGEMIKEMCFFVCVFCVFVCLFVCFKTTPPVHACFQSGAQKADKVFDTPHVWTEKCNAFRGERERQVPD